MQEYLIHLLSELFSSFSNITSINAYNFNLHGHQSKNLFNKKVEHTYDTQGLNTAAVSTTIQSQEAIVKNKPPQVTPVTKKNNAVKSQVRHSYTARLRLSIKKFNSVNVGFVLKQMFQLWKEADQALFYLSITMKTTLTFGLMT